MATTAILNDSGRAILTGMGTGRQCQGCHSNIGTSGVFFKTKISEIHDVNRFSFIFSVPLSVLFFSFLFFFVRKVNKAKFGIFVSPVKLILTNHYSLTSFKILPEVLRST